MKVMYPALFEKEDSRYDIMFPDLPEVIIRGDALEQVIETAKECLGLCLDARKKNKEGIPVMSNLFRINCTNGTPIMVIEPDSIDSNKRHNKEAIRKDATIPVWLNGLAEKKSVNFSNVLQNVLMKELNI